MEKEKEIAISIESERRSRKVTKSFETKTKVLNEQNQGLLEIMNVMKLKVDATEINFKEEFEKRKSAETEIFAKSKEIERLQAELSTSSRKLRVLEDALSVVPSSTASKQNHSLTQKTTSMITTTVKPFSPFRPEPIRLDIERYSVRQSGLLTKRVGFNKTSPLMRPNPPWRGLLREKRRRAEKEVLW